MRQPETVMQKDPDPSASSCKFFRESFGPQMPPVKLLFCKQYSAVRLVLEIVYAEKRHGFMPVHGNLNSKSETPFGEPHPKI